MAAAVAAVGLLICLAAAAVAATGSVRMVETGGRYAFSPQTISVHVGDRVTWTNGSDAPHTVTSDTAGVINSAVVGGGKSFSMTFSSTGTVAYHCSIHPYMHGMIQVLAAGATLPATDTVATEPLAQRGGWQGTLVAGLAGLAFGLWQFGRGQIRSGVQAAISRTLHRPQT